MQWSHIMPDDTNENLSSELLEYVKLMLQNPEYVLKAIQDRNVEINSLKAMLKHQGLVFDETASRHDHIFEEKEKLTQDYQNLVEKYENILETHQAMLEDHEVLIKEFILMKEKVDVNELLYKKTVTGKVESFANKLGGWKGILLKVMLTPPVSYVLIAIIFALFMTASIIGWAGVLSSIQPLIDLFDIFT